MASITLRDIPDALHERLRAAAERNRRSLNSEIIALLEQATVPRPSAEEVIARIKKLNKGIKHRFTEEEIVGTIRRMRDEG